MVMRASPKTEEMIQFPTLMALWRLRRVECQRVLGWIGENLSLGSEPSHCFESRFSFYLYPLAWIVFKQTVIDLIYFPNGCILLSLRNSNIQDTWGFPLHICLLSLMSLFNST